ncbi:MAG TPA: DUF2147 domain-containing protein [Methyloceanibacter sp.]|nr:DUF2147 domain-containing protein [Methyloceanibacter sp.]
MKHQAYTAAMALIAAGLLAPVTPTAAAAADPTGIWMKPDSERPARIEVKKCGGTKLCAKIIWLENPKDSRGNPLRDIRNSNPSHRGRTILGLPLFSGFAPSGPNAWAGQIYNPEDGNTYSATLTLVSHKQITLKGCKAFGLLCGQKTWVRSTIPGKVEEPVVTPTEQIEARAEPTPAPKATAPAAEVASAPAAPEPKPQVIQAAVSEDEILKPEMPATYHDHPQGFGFITTSAPPETAPPFSSQSPSSMFAFTKVPAEQRAPVTQTASSTPSGSVTHVSTAPSRPTHAAPQATTRMQTAAQTSPTAPAGKPKPTLRTPVTASAGGTAPITQPVEAAPGEAMPDATPEEMQQADAADAEMAVTDARPLSRRERRLLRRSGGSNLPWLQQ